MILLAISVVSAEPDKPRNHPEVRIAILFRFTYTGQPRVPTPEEIRAERQEEEQTIMNWSAGVIAMGGERVLTWGMGEKPSGSWL